MKLWKKWLSAAMSAMMVAATFTAPAGVKAADSWETPIIDLPGNDVA